MVDGVGWSVWFGSFGFGVVFVVWFWVGFGCCFDGGFNCFFGLGFG